MLGLVVGDTPPEVNDAVGTGKTVMLTLTVSVVRIVDCAGQRVAWAGQLMIVETCVAKIVEVVN